MRYAKAVVAALVAGLGQLVIALEDESLTWGEGIGAAIVGLVALGAVFTVPNKQPTA